MVHDLLGQAYAALRYIRRRTALTMAGMAWGIATVVILLSYGAGFGRAIHNIFANFGVQMMGIFPGRSSLQAGGMKAGTETRFTLDDVQHIQDAVPLINHISLRPAWMPRYNARTACSRSPSAGFIRKSSTSAPSA